MRRTVPLLATIALVATIAVPAGAANSSSDASLADRAQARRDAVVGQLDAAPNVGAVSASSAMRDDGLGLGDEPRTYLVRLAGEAVPSYRGGRDGFARTSAARPTEFDERSVASRRYAAELGRQQDRVIARAEGEFRRQIEVPYRYEYALNGFAAVLTPAEARVLARDPDVVDIRLDEERELQTDQGPARIRATEVYPGSAAAGLELADPSVRGEGVIVGIIDSGINPSNPSFLDLGETDGSKHDHTNPFGPGNYVGVCDDTDPSYDPLFPCNDKLIGAWSFVYDGATGGALDDDGHGTHTASTAAGNPVTATITPPSEPTVTEFEIAGVAPNANIISYMGCCTLGGLTASIDQAIEDGVDVINYSIGSSSPSALWDDFDTVGYLNARAAGIFVATSNGNDGPGPDTTGSPSDAPWIISVGASTHDRLNLNQLVDMTGGGTPPADIDGVGVTGPLGSTAIVYAGDVGDALCEETAGNEAAFTDKIVVCDRGVIGRVAKSFNVAAQGAVGFVLANDEDNGDSLSGDAFAIPGLHIGFDDGEVLKAWLASGTGHEAAITGTTFDVDPANADIMAGFSSRGANRAVEVIVPDLSAPGVDVLAAYGQSFPPGAPGSSPTDPDYDLAEWDFLSGTSMASPHVAGAGALLRQARPDWSPAEMQSAFMMTANPAVTDNDGTPASPYDTGAGRIDVAAAVISGLLMDETYENYLAADPADGGDAKTLNLPSFNDQQCLQACSWDRTLTSSAIGAADATITWTPSFDSDPGLTLTMDQASYDVASGASVDVTVTADVDGAPTDAVLFGRITLTPSDADIPDVTMPVAVLPSNGVLPDALEITAQRDQGSELVPDLQAIPIADFEGRVAGLVEATTQSGSLPQDVGQDPYDDPDADGVDVYWVDVPADARRLVAEIVSTTSPDIDLFVGRDADDENDVDVSEEVAFSASGGSAETVDINDPEAGSWWILVQNWEASDPDGEDPYELRHAVVPDVDLGNAAITAPDDVPTGELFDARFSWDLRGVSAAPGDVFYGVAELGSDTGQAGDIGSIPVTLVRVEDDVQKSVTPYRAQPGDTVTYAIAVAPNLGNEDVTHVLTDTLPDGMSYVPGSASIAPERVDGQELVFSVTQDTAFGKPVDWVASTPATSPVCAADPGYLDLWGAFGIGPDPAMDGDTVAFNYSISNAAPFPFTDGISNGLTVAEDGFVTAFGGYGGEPWVPQSVPNADAPNGVVAPLWSDLVSEFAAGDIVDDAPVTGTEAGVTIASAPGLALIEWDDLGEWRFDGADVTAGPSIGDFQLEWFTTVDPDFPEITFRYENTTAELAAIDSGVAIAMESISGGAGTEFFFGADPTAAIDAANGTVCWDLEGPQQETIVVTYDATIDASVRFGATLVNEVVGTTEDPVDGQVVATASVDVVPNVPPAFTPASTNFAQTIFVGQGLVPLEGTDGDGDALSFAVANGELPPGITLDADGTFVGTAAEQGVYRSTVSVSDGDAVDTASLVVTVDNRAPTAVDDTAATKSTVPVDVDVVANDSDPDGDDLVVTDATEPEHGTVTCDGGTCTYTSDTDFVGDDVFVYTVSDGVGGEASATVTVTVSAPDTDPDPDPDPEPDPDPVPEVGPVAVTLGRAAGEDRIATSLQLSQEGWPDGAATAILVRADEYPDALAGVTMAAAYDAPILQNPQDGLRDDVADELERLGVVTVIVLGGEAALAPQVVTDLEALDLGVVRLAGENRFGTAEAVLETLVDPDLVDRDEPRYDRAIVTLGNSPVPGQDGWVDALSAGTLATTGIPVVLTGRDALPQESADALVAGVVPGGRVTVVGGPVAVSDDVLDDLTALGFVVDRVAGENRYATSAAAVEAAFELGASRRTAIAASGRNYPDALSGAVTAWKLGGYLTLVDPQDLDDSPETRDLLVANADPMEFLLIAGGPAAISDDVVSQLQAAVTQ